MGSSIISLNTYIKTLLASRPVILQLLRFAAIGAINTALDFIILNYITKLYNISAGFELGLLNTVSFSAAIIQSYLWNRAWAFQKNTSGNLQNAIRLLLVGGLGFSAFVAVIWGAAIGASPVYFLSILITFILIELILWRKFELKLSSTKAHTATQFVAFVIISVIGLLINSLLVSVISTAIAPSLSQFVNPDTVKNAAKAFATIASLIWNFLGYKLVVFRK